MKRSVVLLVAMTLIVLFAVSASAKLPQDQGFSLAVQLDDTHDTSTADYLYDLPSGGHWLAGDRSGYDCAYTFLEWQNQIVGRVAFHRVTSAEAYTQINDRYMEEGVRYYDGTLNTDPRVNDTGTAGLSNTSTLDACINSTVIYGDLQGSPSLPIIRFFDARDGTLIETRNYANVQVEGRLSFAIVEQTAARTAVGVFRHGVAVGVVYYTPLSPDVVMTTNQASPPSTTITMPPPTTTVSMPPPTTSPPTTDTPKAEKTERKGKGCPSGTKRC